VTSTYQVTHRTEYRYEADVVPSYGVLHLLPRDLPWQRCRAARIEIDPEPSDFRERQDFFGNRRAYFAIQAAHRHLVITASTTVEVDDPPPRLFADHPWERARETGPEATAFLIDSPLVPASDLCEAYAGPSFAPDRPFLEAVTDLNSRIHADFTYKPGATSVTTTLSEVFEKREGVCQDFAHVAIGCLRSMGLSARYVSGYLETDPPPGRPKLIGADVSHAWVSVHLPEAGWIDLDPTNDRLVNDRYVTTAYGRDYSDVPPVNGVIYTDGKTKSLEVRVDVTAV
jgi:transglutaminase-like putative cysteine protease